MSSASQSPCDSNTIDRPDSMETFRMYPHSCLASGAKVLSKSSSSAANCIAPAHSFNAAWTISRSALYSAAASRSASPFCCTAARTIARSVLCSSGSASPFCCTAARTIARSALHSSAA
eukprot:5223399-Amphidinium_carterae.1